jgi:hypothetical protein
MYDQTHESPLRCALWYISGVYMIKVIYRMSYNLPHVIYPMPYNQCPSTQTPTDPIPQTVTHVFVSVLTNAFTKKL